MNIKFLAVFFLIIASACNDDDASPQPGAIDSVVLVDEAVPAINLELDVFEAIPDTIDGCGDFYTYDSIPPKDNRYVFLSNMTDFAVMKIEGREIYLKKNERESREITPAHFISVFEGEGYKAILEARITEQYDEGGFYKGKLQIISQDQKVIYNVHGQSGC